jgi:hypothetical protein
MVFRQKIKLLKVRLKENWLLLDISEQSRTTEHQGNLTKVL